MGRQLLPSSPSATRWGQVVGRLGKGTWRKHASKKKHRGAMNKVALRAGWRTGAVPIAGDGELATRAGRDRRACRAPTLILGASLACFTALMLPARAAPTAPSAHTLASPHGLRGQTTARLPINLTSTASASIGASERRFSPVGRGASLLTEGGGIQSTFTASGATLRVAQGTLSVSLRATGREALLTPVHAAPPAGAGSLVLYRYGSLSEFYRNGPYGLEQGFSVRQRPRTGTGSLVLALSVGGSLVPRQTGSQIQFPHPCGHDRVALRPAQRTGCGRPPAANADAAR